MMTHIQPQTRVFDPKGHETFVTHTACLQSVMPNWLLPPCNIATRSCQLLLQDHTPLSKVRHTTSTPFLHIHICQMMNWHWAPTVLDKIGAGS
ncbi:hypothetical protein DL95DRAFT_387704 [Leptodontidium sp. 2 PMI_412]|nr:hypothetical protein DL95DRAFT_387704 [Leptodontidium sp. 2 PMI_412]